MNTPTAQMAPRHSWRAGRGTAALSTDHFRIDDRTLAERVAWFRAIAGLFCVPSPTGTADTDFGTILDKDVTFVLAETALFDAPARFVAGRLPRGLSGGAQEGADLIESWLARLKESNLPSYADDIDPRYRNLITSVLLDELEGVDLGTVSLGELTRGLREDVGALSGGVRIEPRFLDSAMMRALQRISAGSKRLLETALTGGNDHPPDVGLALAFLHICGKTQEAINNLTARHLDFYYEKVLGLAPRVAGPDHVIVGLELAQDRASLVLPRDTAFGAGRDAAGHQINFLSDRALEVTPARIVHRATLHLDQRMRPPLSSGDPPRLAVSRILVRPNAASADGFGAPLAPGQGWPIFGAVAHTDAPDAIDAQLGLEVEAPILALSGGRREIIVTLRTKPGPDGTLADAVDRFADLRRGAALKAAFELSVSSAKGNVEVTDFSVGARGDDLTFTFTLPPAAPPLAPSEEQPGAQPRLTVGFRQEQARHAVQAFAGLLLDSVDITVDVVGLRPSTLSNLEGPLSPDKPFMPFGATPPRGSVFTIAHPELAKPGISSVALTLEWANLPLPPDDLTAHYADWNLGIANDSFRVDLEFRGPSGWEPLWRGAFDSGNLRLFEPLMPAGLSPKRRFEAMRPGGYGPITALQLRLIAPAEGFGRDAYPALVAETAAAQARAATRRRLFGLGRTQPPMPRPPFTPVAQAVAIDYTATARVGLDGAAGRLSALLPFGRRTKGTAPLVLADLPRDGERLFCGTLYLGLDRVRPLERVTLFFDLEEAPGRARAAGSDSDDLPEPVWRYLDGDEWRDLPRPAVESDSTMGFRTSGIATIRMPSGWERPGAEMPPAGAWLSVSAPVALVASLGRARSVTAQAVGATRRRGPLEGEPAAPVSALRDGKLAAGIAKIRQPGSATIGVPAESKQAFHIRVSERLSHKDRAVRPLDFERIVLAAFPKIADCRCLPGPNAMVTLVVSPVRCAFKTDLSVPDVLLGQIAEHVAPRVPEGAGRLVVRPVAAERIRVTAVIKLERSAGPTTPQAIERALATAIAPWLADAEARLPIGTGGVATASVTRAVEALDDVRQVLNLHLVRFFATDVDPARLGDPEGTPPPIHRLEDSARWSRGSGNMTPSAPYATLVPARRHRLTLIDAEDDHRFLAPIGYAEVGKDAVAPSWWNRWQRTDDPIYLVRPELAGIGNLVIGEEFTVTNHASGPLSKVMLGGRPI